MTRPLHTDAPDGFVEWMRRESVSTFSATVTTNSGIEPAAHDELAPWQFVGGVAAPST